MEGLLSRLSGRGYSTLGCVGVHIRLFWIRRDETAHLLYMSDLEVKTAELVYLTGVVQIESIVFRIPGDELKRVEMGRWLFIFRFRGDETYWHVELGWGLIIDFLDSGKRNK